MFFFCSGDTSSADPADDNGGDLHAMTETAEVRTYSRRKTNEKN